MSKPFIISGEAYNLNPFVLPAPSGNMDRIITKITMTTVRDVNTDDTINTIQLNGYKLARFVQNDSGLFTISLDNEFIIQRHNSVDSLSIFSTAEPSPSEKTYITIHGIEILHADDTEIDYEVFYFTQSSGLESVVGVSPNGTRRIVKQYVINGNTPYTVDYYVTKASSNNLPLYGAYQISNNSVSATEQKIVIDVNSNNEFVISPQAVSDYTAVVFVVKIKV